MAFTLTSRGYEYDIGGYTGLSMGDDVLEGTMHLLVREKSGHVNLSLMKTHEIQDTSLCVPLWFNSIILQYALYNAYPR